MGFIGLLKLSWKFDSVFPSCQIRKGNIINYLSLVLHDEKKTHNNCLGEVKFSLVFRTEWNFLHGSSNRNCRREHGLLIISLK